MNQQNDGGLVKNRVALFEKKVPTTKEFVPSNTIKAFLSSQTLVNNIQQQPEVSIKQISNNSQTKLIPDNVPSVKERIAMFQAQKSTGNITYQPKQQVMKASEKNEKIDEVVTYAQEIIEQIPETVKQKQEFEPILTADIPQEPQNNPPPSQSIVTNLTPKVSLNRPKAQTAWETTPRNEGPIPAIAIPFEDEIVVSNPRVQKTLANLGPTKYTSSVIDQCQPYLINSTRDIYIGQWKNGKKCGYGMEQKESGAIYEGQWNDDAVNGWGRIIQADGDAYVQIQLIKQEGQWENNQASGFGVYFHTDGEMYEGEWENNVYHGKGIWKRKDGAVYDGMFKNGKKEGKGIFVYNGTKYIGEYFDDNKEGYGEFYWPDGKNYKGGWKNDFKHGVGVFTDKEGQSIEAEWVDGVKVHK